jgi:hypothetical protein
LKYQRWKIIPISESSLMDAYINAALEREEGKAEIFPTAMTLLYHFSNPTFRRPFISFISFRTTHNRTISSSE